MTDETPLPAPEEPAEALVADAPGAPAPDAAATPDPDAAPPAVAAPLDEAEQPKRGLHLTPRQAFWGLAIALGLALIALLVYLLFFLSASWLGVKGGAVVMGIEPLLTIQGPGVGVNPTFSRPLGAAFDNQGRIWVSDTGNNRIAVFASNGNFLFEFGGFGVAKPAAAGTYSWAPGRLNFPTGIAGDTDGNMYVADFRNDQIQVFDYTGKYVRKFPDNQQRVGRGSSGQDGKGIAVTALAVAGDYVYATDTYQVFVFSREGKVVRQFGKPGRGPGDLDHPNGIAVGRDGTIYVADSNHARVTAFTPDGKPIWNAGRIPAGMNDTSPRAFDLPRGIAVLPDNNVLVIDTFGFDLVRLSPAGRVVANYGERGVGPGQFDFPNSVSAFGDRLLVSDKENNRAQVVRIVAR